MNQHRSVGVVFALVMAVLVGCASELPASDEGAQVAGSSFAIQFSVSPAFILPGESADLNWEALDATICQIDGILFGGGGDAKLAPLAMEGPGGGLPGDGGGGSADLPPSGTTSVNPATTTSYTVVCEDAAGATSSATVELSVSTDEDNDGYPTALEVIAGTDPTDSDSDDDGVLDGLEDSNRNGLVDGNETDPLNPASRNPYYCDGLRYDNDGDGLDFPSTCSNPERFAAGDRHACVIASNGLTYCWGRNQFMQLGVSDTSNNIGDNELASAGPSFSGLIQVSAGDSTTCGLRASGTVLCWGRGNDGVSGQAHENMTSFANAEVNLPEPMIQVATSGSHTCAVSQIGNLYCWGNNSFGQLGYENNDDIGDNEHPDAAGPVNVGAPVRQVSVGFSSTCALLTSGSVRCWGFFNQGQLGLPYDSLVYGSGFGDDLGEAPINASTVPMGGSAFQIASGSGHTCAVTGGSLVCWGQGFEGKLGYGSTNNIGDDENAGTAVNYGGGEIANISAGQDRTCIALQSGDARCWGAGTHGLGYGNTNSIGDDEPAQAGGNLNFEGKHALTIATGNSFSCALMQDDSVYCWGLNDAGQLGQGDTSTVLSSHLGEVQYQ